MSPPGGTLVKAPVGEPSRVRCDRGSAPVEFLVVAVLVLVPLVAVVLAVAAVQRTTFAAEAAVREAGRAFVTADTPDGAQARGRAAARLALADHGIDLPARALRFTCLDGPCLSPRSRVVVELRLSASVPALPAVLAGAVPARVPVTARHVEVVDDYRGSP